VLDNGGSAEEGGAAAASKGGLVKQKLSKMHVDGIKAPVARAQQKKNQVFTNI
jgi:hypothetical protein